MTTAHKERLLAILREAAAEGCVWMDDWIKEVEAEKIRNNKLYRWLNHHQNYYQPKDREYAAYIKGLMTTWGGL